MFERDRGEIQALIAKRATENAMNLSLEDLALISDFCRFYATVQTKRVEYVQAMKPFIIQSWESGAFKEKETALLMAARFAIAVASTYKYSDEEAELWDTIIEMLNWALVSQESSKLIAMDPLEFVRLVTCLSRRREVDAALWGLMAKVLVTQMNTKKMGIVDLMVVTRSLVNAKVRSDKLYGFITRYFMAIGFSEKAKVTTKVNTPIFFFLSLAKGYPSMSDQVEFFAEVNGYL